MGLLKQLINEDKGDDGWREIPFAKDLVRPVGTGMFSLFFPISFFRSPRPPLFQALLTNIKTINTTVGPLNTLSLPALSNTFIPTLFSLSPTTPLSDQAPEISMPTLDLCGGYHSRAQRTQRFNDIKAEEKKFGLEKRKEENNKGGGGRRARKGVGEVELL